MLVAMEIAAMGTTLVLVGREIPLFLGPQLLVGGGVGLGGPA